MAHCVDALIGGTEMLARFSRENLLHPPVELGHGLSLLGLRSQEIDAMFAPPLSFSMGEFVIFCDELATAVTGAAAGNPWMYFETEYFGGVGRQAAVVFREGAPVYRSDGWRPGPINRALRLLGVEVRAPACDEFESIGLDRYRSTEGWNEEGRGEGD